MIDMKKVEQSYKNGEVDIEKATDELEEFYENAGFSDFRNRKLAEMTDWAIIDSYLGTFCDEYRTKDECLDAIRAIGLPDDCLVN